MSATRSLANEGHSNSLQATLSRPPLRTAPNSARKRTERPHLSRPNASPSHSQKMSQLFQNVAASLGSHEPYVPNTCNASRSRLPASGNRNRKFGQQFGHDQTDFQDKLPNLENEAQSAGFEQFRALAGSVNQLALPARYPAPTTPVHQGNQTSDLSTTRYPHYPASPPEDQSPSEAELPPHDASGGQDGDGQQRGRLGVNNQGPHVRNSCPKIRFGNLPPSSPPILGSLSDSDDCHSSHGTRLIVPFTHTDAENAQTASIDAWLDDVLGAARIDVSQVIKELEAGVDRTLHGDNSVDSLLKQGLDTDQLELPSSRGSSNKENASPIATPSPQLADLPSSANQPPGFRRHDPAVSSPISLPKRIHSPWSIPGKGPLSAPPRRKGSGAMPNVARDFTVQDDKLADALKTLGPSVERHRKGRKPKRKRERDASYWDIDIFDKSSPAYPWARSNTDGLVKGDRTPIGSPLPGPAAIDSALKQAGPESGM